MESYDVFLKRHTESGFIVSKDRSFIDLFDNAMLSLVSIELGLGAWSAMFTKAYIELIKALRLDFQYAIEKKALGGKLREEDYVSVRFDSQLSPYLQGYQRIDGWAVVLIVLCQYSKMNIEFRNNKPLIKALKDYLLSCYDDPFTDYFEVKKPAKYAFNRGLIIASTAMFEDVFEEISNHYIIDKELFDRELQTEISQGLGIPHLLLCYPAKIYSLDMMGALLGNRYMLKRYVDDESMGRAYFSLGNVLKGLIHYRNGEHKESMSQLRYLRIIKDSFGLIPDWYMSLKNNDKWVSALGGYGNEDLLATGLMIYLEELIGGESFV